MAKLAGVLVLFLCGALLEISAVTARAQVRVQTRIVSQVDLVRVPLIVFDKKGRVATDLTKSDFRLFEDGVEQRILGLKMERVPVSFLVLADVSSSMTHKIGFVQEAALSLLDPNQPVGKNVDEYSVLSISTQSRVLVPFTHDQQDLERRLPFLLAATDGSTSLLDGIWLGVNTAEDDAANEQSAMIIITDGGDNHSRVNLRQTERLLEESDVPIFAVMAGPMFELPSLVPEQRQKTSGIPKPGEAQAGIPMLPFLASSEDYIGPAERRGPRIMKALTEVSGGGVFTARREEDLARIVRTIGLAVRYRYILTYKPTRDDPFENQRQGETAKLRKHIIHIELYPKTKFAGYSMPYYKSGYDSTE
ncbi:MAG TPA: VWA domain-containing protein [Candidatus Sulfotelmatobacter sp.]|nr:VWA domain-containing protein [Candidatus Sulfotelmatobacter sp.]